MGETEPSPRLACLCCPIHQGVGLIALISSARAGVAWQTHPIRWPALSAPPSLLRRVTLRVARLICPPAPPRCLVAHTRTHSPAFSSARSATTGDAVLAPCPWPIVEPPADRGLPHPLADARTRTRDPPDPQTLSGRLGSLQFQLGPGTGLPCLRLSTTHAHHLAPPLSPTLPLHTDAACAARPSSTRGS